MNNSNHLQGLSIIRTLAAFSVLLGHYYQFGFGKISATHIWLPELYTPVVTFFVISGFLIAWGLLKEQDKTGSVNIVYAYQKRAIRILPLYYIGIGLGILSLWICGDKLDGNVSLLLLGMPHISHILGSTPFPMWHYWTLGAEIMFYLWFPWLIKFCRKYVLQVVAAICIGWFILKIGTYALLGKGYVYRFVSVLHTDSIMLGSLAAILFYKECKWLINLCQSGWFVVCSWILFLSTNLWAEYIPSPFRAEVIAILSVMVLLAGFCGHPMLENKVTQYLGTISYAIYIFHPIMIYGISYACSAWNIHCESMIEEYIRVTIVLLLTIGISALANAIDKQITTKLRQRISYPKS